MFAAIISGDHTLLAHLATSFLKRGNTDAAVLSLDHYFEQTPALLDLDIKKTAEELKLFFDYVHILHDLAFLVDPSNNPKIWKLFGIHAGDEEGVVNIPANSVIFTHVRTLEGEQPSSQALGNDKFVEAFRACLCNRLLDRVTRENDACRKAPALEPCLRHVVYGDCDVSPCPRPHIIPDAVWFEHWINAHLLQILIYHSINGIQFRRQMEAEKKSVRLL